MWWKLDDISTIDLNKEKVNLHGIICIYIARIKLDRKWIYKL